MKLFASLDPRDRKLLAGCLIAVVVLAVLTGIFGRNQNNDDNPLPSTYLTGRHGARAAFDLLQENGYHIQRWEQPLGELAQIVDSKTVVIFADPGISGAGDFKVIDQIVSRGARVLITGFSGGALAPGNAVLVSEQLQAPCKLTPQGLDPLADTGEVWMAPSATWGFTSPGHRVDYNCAGAPAVVEYDHGAGHIVWWAGSTPLENGSIRRAANLDLFLNALGPRDGHDFYWDESLHGETRSEWFYARGSALNLLLAGLGGIALLVVFSFSRRRGPLRDVPAPARATPVEFLEALGSLYGKAGASNTALTLAWDRFRRQAGHLCGRKGMQMNAAELAALLRRRFPQASPDLDTDLAACEDALTDEELAPKRALALVQALSRHGDLLSTLARTGTTTQEWRH